MVFAPRLFLLGFAALFEYRRREAGLAYWQAPEGTIVFALVAFAFGSVSGSFLLLRSVAEACSHLQDLE